MQEAPGWSLSLASHWWWGYSEIQIGICVKTYLSRDCGGVHVVSFERNNTLSRLKNRGKYNHLTQVSTLKWEGWSGGRNSLIFSGQIHLLCYGIVFVLESRDSWSKSLRTLAPLLQLTNNSLWQSLSSKSKEDKASPQPLFIRKQIHSITRIY